MADRDGDETALDNFIASLTADGEADKLTGAAEEDWFLTESKGLVTDAVANGKGNGGKGRSG